MSRFPPPAVPPNELTEFRLGAHIQVFHVYQQKMGRVGQLIHIVEPNVVPDPAAMDVLFRYNKQATATDLPPIPVKPSKFRRLILQGRGGLSYCYTANPRQHRFYPGSTKEER